MFISIFYNMFLLYNLSRGIFLAGRDSPYRAASAGNPTFPIFMEP